MTDQPCYYQRRAVAFLDVLGFRKLLTEFEKDAVAGEAEGQEFWVSQKVNEFVDTVKNVLSLLDKDKFRYYLFSDNICITVDYIESPSVLFDLLFTINDLFFAFAQKGYFLRGGIDIGKFVDEEKIAIGVPLATAYLIESKTAIYPRVVLSPDFVNQLNISANDGNAVYKASLESLLVKSSCELQYLNVFHAVFRKTDKIAFFQTYKDKIEEQLAQSVTEESIHVKYSWLAIQYNVYLKEYLSEFAGFSDEDLEDGVAEALADISIDLETTIQLI